MRTSIKRVVLGCTVAASLLGATAAPASADIGLGSPLVGRWVDRAGEQIVFFSGGYAKAATDFVRPTCTFHPGDLLAGSIVGSGEVYAGDEYTCSGSTGTARFVLSNNDNSLSWTGSVAGVNVGPWDKLCGGSDQC